MQQQGGRGPSLSLRESSPPGHDPGHREFHALHVSGRDRNNHLLVSYSSQRNQSASACSEEFIPNNEFILIDLQIPTAPYS